MLRLTAKQKWMIIHSMESTHNISRTAREVGLVGCGLRTVKRWWERFKFTGGVACKRSPGRKPILSHDAAALALQLMTQEDNHGAKEAARHLAAAGGAPKVVHKSTLIRAARKAAKQQGQKVVAVQGKPPKGLTQATREKRLKFALANLHRRWNLVMFTDRKKFLFSYPGSKVKRVRWSLAGHQHDSHQVFQPSHAQCVNVYAGISKYGITPLHTVAGTSKHTTAHTNQRGQAARNITAFEYKCVLSSTLLPAGSKMFTTQGISTWFLQQDNDSTHACATQIINEWNRKKGSSIQLLPDWPPNSPDLNIIENVWGLVQEKVESRGCSSFEEFRDAVKEEMAAVPGKLITNLFKSLPKRMQLVVSNCGQKIGY